MFEITRAEQQVLVHDLLQGLEQEIVKAIKEGKIPENWTGIELRQYIADKAKEQIAYLKMSRINTKDYRNDLIVNNL